MATFETPQDRLETFQAGTNMPVVIVYNAQHGGNMDFRLCRRGVDSSLGSREAAAECLDEILLHRQCVPGCGCTGDSCRSTKKTSKDDRMFEGRGPPYGMIDGADELMIPIPAGLSCERCTIQWFWTTAWGEQFWNCFDVKITPGNGGPVLPLPLPAPPMPTPVPKPSPTASGGIGSDRCWWTEPAGAVVTFSPREQKQGRNCYDVTAPKGVTIFYQAKADIYHQWGADSCCLYAADGFGSKTGGEANIVALTATYGGFGFCECTAWDPSNPGVSCAGQADANNMLCPVQGATDKMCQRREALLSRPIDECGTGDGTQPQPQPVPQPVPAPTPAPTPKCTDDWGNCIHSQCCQSSGFKCLEQDASYAECRSDRCPKGWSCKDLGAPNECMEWCTKPPVSKDERCSWSYCAACSECSPPAPTPPYSPPTPPYSPPTPPYSPPTPPPPASTGGGAFCCHHPLNNCGGCETKADSSNWCGMSESNCGTCQGTWCA